MNAVLEVNTCCTLITYPVSYPGLCPERIFGMPEDSNRGHVRLGAVSWENHDDEDLVRLAQGENRQAFDELIRRYQKRVYRIAYQMSYSDGEEAKDLAQTVFLKAFQGIKKFDGRSSFYTWLYRIVVNTCLSSRRRHLRWGRIFFPWRMGKIEEGEPEARDEAPDASATLSEHQFREDIKRTLDDLSKRQRMVFQLKIFEEMKISEIAEITGMAEGTVKTHLFRATQMVRKKLQHWMKK